MRPRLAALRVRAPDLVVIQGGINDLGMRHLELPAATGGMYTAVRSRFPGAQVVVVGPAPSSWPMDTRLPGVDDYIGTAARAAGLRYIDPLAEHWVTASNVGQVIDPATQHPSTAGHAYLAGRLTADLRAMGG